MTKFLAISGLIIVIAGLIFVAAAFGIPMLINITHPNPPEPTVRYGEFPFKIIYQFKGEQFIVEGIYICEYDGITTSEAGKRLRWKEHIKDSEENDLLLAQDGNIKIYCTLGSGAYYMGEDGFENADSSDLAPRVYTMSKTGTMTVTDLLSDEEKEKYGFELISWKFSSPIENTFE